MRFFVIQFQDLTTNTALYLAQGKYLFIYPSKPRAKVPTSSPLHVQWQSHGFKSAEVGENQLLFCFPVLSHHRKAELCSLRGTPCFWQSFCVGAIAGLWITQMISRF